MQRVLNSLPEHSTRRRRVGDFKGLAIGYSAGTGFGVIEGWPPELTLPEPRFRPDTPELARIQVRKLAERGTHILKIWLDDFGGKVPKIHAGLCPSDEHVRVVFHRVLEEFDLAGYMLKEVMDGDSAMRRPRFTMTHRIRADALLALHTQQVTLLRQWCGALAANDNASADRLACINAIASGLRTTG